MFSTIFPFRALNDAFKYKSSIMCTLPHVYVVFGGGGGGGWTKVCVCMCTDNGFIFCKGWPCCDFITGLVNQKIYIIGAFRRRFYRVFIPLFCRGPAGICWQRYRLSLYFFYGSMRNVLFYNCQHVFSLFHFQWQKHWPFRWRLVQKSTRGLAAMLDFIWSLI